MISESVMYLSEGWVEENAFYVLRDTVRKRESYMTIF